MSEETYTTNLDSCNPSDCASCTANCSSAGGSSQGSIPKVPNPTIKLTLDDDSVLECAVLTTFPGRRLWRIHCPCSSEQRRQKYRRRNLPLPLCRRRQYSCCKQY